MSRITVQLTDEERNVLCEMAREDMRDPRDQLRWILREAAERRLLWHSLSQVEVTKYEKGSD